MDYHRIYREFIKDRREKEPGLTGYTERHHILPRSLGGTDDADNLIELTSEDHFFAHLLLAKMHGGKMASALHLMLQRPRNLWRRRFSSRRSYGFAARLAYRMQSEAWEAESNPLFNETVYFWWNVETGERLSGRIYDMHLSFGGSRPSWTMVVNGQKASVASWTLAANAKSHKRSTKGVVRRFVNRDGREFEGTQTEFMAMTGLSPAQACRVVKEAAITRDGWRLAGVEDRHFNATRDGRNSGAEDLGRIYRLHHPRHGRFTGRVGDFMRVAGCKNRKSAQAALSGLMSGKLRTSYGWSIHQQG